jgi:hypothetical protein
MDTMHTIDKDLKNTVVHRIILRNRPSGRAVMQRTANPCRSVRLRSRPRQNGGMISKDVRLKKAFFPVW